MEGGGRRMDEVREQNHTFRGVTCGRLGRMPLNRAALSAELGLGFRGCSCGRHAHGSRTHSRAKLSAHANRAEFRRAEYGFKADLAR